MSTQPRPVFIYGTLCAMPLLAWVLTGVPSNVQVVSALVRKARAYGFARFSLHDRDYPAIVEQDAHSSVDGYLLTLETTSQRKELDEGEAYKIMPVSVTILDADGEPSEEMAEADIYLWDGEMEEVSSEPWELDRFIRERLDDWIDLFEAIELVGED